MPQQGSYFRGLVTLMMDNFQSLLKGRNAGGVILMEALLPCWMIWIINSKGGPSRSQNCEQTNFGQKNLGKQA
jgi:hypothetical protein